MTGPESTDSDPAAPSHLVEATDIRFAHRHLGDAMATPLVFLQQIPAGTDYGDPTVAGGRARHRPVVIFDNAGVASSIGGRSGTIGMGTKPAPTTLLTTSGPDSSVRAARSVVTTTRRQDCLRHRRNRRRPARTAATRRSRRVFVWPRLLEPLA
jgi:hypothetical protein